MKITNRFITIMMALSVFMVSLGSLGGCSSGNDWTKISPTEQQTSYKTVMFNGSIDNESSAKAVIATVEAVGSVSAIDAKTGKALLATPVDITSTNQFSGLTIELPSPRTVIVLIATLNAGSTYRGIIPFDLSNPPTGLVLNNALNIVIGPSSDAVAVAVSKALGVTGTLGDSGVLLPTGKDYAAVATSVVSNGGCTVFFGTAGITVNGSLDSVAVSKSLTMTIAHLNDTHSQLEPTAAIFKLPSTSTFTNTQVLLGGVTRFKTAVDELRSKEPNVLLLHAGDAVQGIFDFTQYQGVADYDFLNFIRIDALTLGNHEFDKGTQLTAYLVKQANFPVISANLDVSGDTNMNGLIKPYTIKSFGTERVGIIGLSLPITSEISSPGPNVKFNNPTTSVVATVAQLKAQGINKIIVLSHMGYNDDVKLAKAVNGIGVIIGGHSHILMGGNDFKGTGLSFTPSVGTYPTEVTNPSGKKVLVAHAWEWFKVLGALKVTFDADGTVQSYENKEKIIVSDVIYQKSASTDATYTILQAGSDAYKAVVASLPSAAQVYAEEPRTIRGQAVY